MFGGSPQFGGQSFVLLPDLSHEKSIPETWYHKMLLEKLKESDGSHSPSCNL